MLHSKTYRFILTLTLLVNFACSSQIIPLKADQYYIQSEENEPSTEWSAEIHHLLRANSKEHKAFIFRKDTSTVNDVKTIKLHIDSSALHDYCISHSSSKLQITIKSKANKTWMSNQLLNALAKEDMRFASKSTFPNTLSFSSECKNFDFNYREPHFPFNLKEENARYLGNHSVDLDWGIWGHNLEKVLKVRNDKNIYAEIDGEINTSQLCFSSKSLKERLSNYIITNFGEGNLKSYNFMIMPMDNNIACLCDHCKELGNTKHNATPAVSFFINQVADDFPNHQFFTSSYLTTSSVPEVMMKKNTGVILSTIELKKGIALNADKPATKSFLNDLKAWKEKTNNVYVWDYASNFDDYLTPIPSLYSLQKQLQFFKENKINGVFLNASGYNYSSFGDMKTFVSGELMKNTNSDIDQLIRLFFKHHYPKHYKLLTNYYLHLEKRFEAKNKPYNIYGGFEETLNSYLDLDEFDYFYNSLFQATIESTGEEKKRLEKLYTALTYTKLQIAYFQNTSKYGCAVKHNEKLIIKPQIIDDLIKLRQYKYFENLKQYKESDGKIVDYLAFWEGLVGKKIFRNKLLNPTIEIKVNQQNAQLIHNGLPAYEKDYHQGWFISYHDLEANIKNLDLKGEHLFKFNFLNNKRHGFYPPERIEIWDNTKILTTLEIDQFDEDLKTIEVSTPIQLNKVEELKIKMKRRTDKSKSQIAIDEIRVIE